MYKDNKSTLGKMLGDEDENLHIMSHYAQPSHWLYIYVKVGHAQNDGAKSNIGKNENKIGFRIAVICKLFISSSVKTVL